MTKKTSFIPAILLTLFLGVALIPTQAQELEKEVKFADREFIPFYNLRKIGNTIIFQGNRKKGAYFEGWYFKMVAKDGSAVLSVIPGISLSGDGKEQHAFIQVINGVTAQTSYFSFPIEAFSFSKKGFAIKIGDNYFSEEMIILDLQDSTTTVSGRVEMFNRVKYSSNRLLNPGIMGWYRFVPFMECYHGVVSLTHDLKGELTVNHKVHLFEDGKGYIEKDWGSSMPSAWIWIQSNNFSNPNRSLMLSIAEIPWLGGSFTGFLGFYYHDQQIHHFATYRRSKMYVEFPDSNAVNIRIENRRNTFLIEAKSNTAGMLKAPVAGSMERSIPESIDGELKITMLDKKGNVLFTDSTNITGVEMVGDYKQFQGVVK
jgi:tocopherol cyclase